MSDERGWQRDLDEADYDGGDYGEYYGPVIPVSAAIDSRAAILGRIVDAARPLIGHSEALAAALSDLDRHDAERDEAWRLEDEEQRLASEGRTTPPRVLWRVERYDSAGTMLDALTCEAPEALAASQCATVPPDGEVRVYRLPEWAEATDEKHRTLFVVPGVVLDIRLDWGIAVTVENDGRGMTVQVFRPSAPVVRAREATLPDALWAAACELGLGDLALVVRANHKPPAYVGIGPFSL